MQHEPTPSRALLKCVKCGAQHDVAGKRAGVKIRCGKCSAILTVPGGGLAGRVVGGYRILKVIGRGGMGAVYLAEQVRLKRKVAFKALKGGRSQDREALAAFHREAISAAQLSHANIVQVYDISMADGIPFISMEYVDGKTLQDILKERKKLPPQETVQIIAQCLVALGRAHHAGIVHSDIKPGNIMLDAEGTVKITDFGLARMMEGGSPADGGKRYGTVLYVSPEQARSAELDHRADLYSLGATMHEMLVGRPPYRGATPRDTLRLVNKEPVPDPRQLDPSIPRPLADVVMKMMAKRPIERFQGAEEVLEALRSAGFVLPGQGDREAGGGMAWARKAALAAVVALAVLGGGFTLAYGLAMGPFAADRPRTTNNHDAAVNSETDEERLRHLEEMLDFAKEFERENPQDYAPIIQAYSAVAEVAAGTRYGLEAQTRVEAVRRRRREAAERRFRQLREKAVGMARDLKVAEAQKALDAWPEAFEGLGFEARLRETHSEVATIVQQAVAEQVSLIYDAIQRGDFDGAREKLARLETTGLKALEERVNELGREIEERATEAERRWAREAPERYRSLLRDVQESTRQRRYDEARDLLEEALEDRRLAAVQALLRRELDHVETAEAVLQAALRALQAEKAGGLRIGGILRTFKRIENDTIVYELYAGGPENRIPVEELDEREVLRLAKATMQPVRAENLIALGVFSLYDAAYGEAQSAFDEAMRNGAQVPRYLRQRADMANITADFDMED